VTQKLKVVVLAAAAAAVIKSPYIANQSQKAELCQYAQHCDRFFQIPFWHISTCLILAQVTRGI